jgi:exopolyphosphatase/pppGpp-phosphohydrolase
MTEKSLIAVINCGSHTIRLIVAESDQDHGVQIVDSSHPVHRLGPGRFFYWIHQKKTMQQAIGVFLQLREMLAGWGIKPEGVQGHRNIRIPGGKNRDAFVDRLEVRTGFQVL